jgi:hypothetical protein
VNRTVNGAGVHDYLKAVGAVWGINPGFSASDIRFCRGHRVPNDLYEAARHGLWYAMRKFK